MRGKTGWGKAAVAAWTGSDGASGLTMKSAALDIGRMEPTLHHLTSRRKGDATNNRREAARSRGLVNG